MVGIKFFVIKVNVLLMMRLVRNTPIAVQLRLLRNYVVAVSRAGSDREAV